MDLSKLPRLSKTDVPPGSPTATSDSDAATASGAEPGGFPVTLNPAPAAPASPAPVIPEGTTTAFCRQCGAPLRPGARFCDSCGAATESRAGYTRSPSGQDLGVGAGVWLSAVIGIVLMLMGRSFGGYLLARLTGQPHHTNVSWTSGPNEGQEVGYWQLEGFTALSDSAIFLFGVAMVLEAVVLAMMNTRLKAKVPLVAVALFITVLATGYNLVVAFKLLSANTIPITSLLAVAFGGYIAVFEWRLLQQLRPAVR